MSEESSINANDKAQKPIELNELISLLEHPRSLFEYHAGQRFTTIRYFFAVFAVFAAAYVTSFSDGKLNDATAALWIRLVLAVMAFVVTAIFFALDKRNEYLVHVDEDGQKQIEGLIRHRYPELDKFSLVENWDPISQKRKISDCEYMKKKMVQYKYVMPRMYRFFLVISVCAGIFTIWHGASGTGH
jgi:hypothetical protein